MIHVYSSTNTNTSRNDARTSGSHEDITYPSDCRHMTTSWKLK